MKRTIVLIAAALVLAGCADGGSSGTGITTARGNISSVTSALRSRSGPTAGIRVTIENTKISAETDPTGLFSLGGNFAGPVGMVFGLPDGSTSRLIITVPRGGEVTLGDVVVDGSSGQATAAVQSVRFGGLVRSTTCAEQLALMVSRRTPDDGNTYDVRLGTASVQDPAGNTLRCENLAAGDAVDVSGEVRREGEVEAHSVEVEDESHAGSGGGEESGSSSGSSGSGGTDDNSGPGGGDDLSGGNSGPGSETSGGESTSTEGETESGTSGPD